MLEENGDGFPLVKRIATHENLLHTSQTHQIRAFSKLEELIIVIGSARETTRTRVLEVENGFLYVAPTRRSPWRSNKWGLGGYVRQANRENQLLRLVSVLKETTDKAKTKMPVVKVMVLCDKDLKDKV